MSNPRAVAQPLDLRPATSNAWPRWTLRSTLWSLTAFAAFGLAVVGLTQGTELLALVARVWARPDLLLVFATTYTAAFWLRALAWRQLIPASYPVGTGDAVRVTVKHEAASYPVGTLRLLGILQVALLANHVFPTKAGELVRVGLLHRAGAPLHVAGGSTLLARLLDMAALWLLALGFGLVAGGAPAPLLAALALPALGIGLVASLWFATARASLPSLPRRLPTRLHSAADRIATAARVATPARTLAATPFVLASWLLEAGALWCVAEAVGVPLSLPVVVAATAFTIVFQAFQVAPGGLGTYEASLTAILVLFGVDPTTALGLALTTHAIKFAYAYLVGFPCFLVETLGARTSRPPATPSPHRQPPAILPRTLRLLSERGARTWRPPDRVYQVLPRVRTTVDPALPAALLALLLAPASVLTTPAALWRLPLALAATLPLIVLARCHHLPRPLVGSLTLVPLAFLALFGAPLLPFPSLAAAALATLFALLLGRQPWLPALWAALLVHALAVGVEQPLAVAAFSLGSLAALVLTRQWWLARHPLPLPPPPAPSQGPLAVVIPVHDESERLDAVVRNVPRTWIAERGFQPYVVVVDDGSTDNSADVARAAGADLVVCHPHRQGLGAALRSGLHAARQGGAVAVVYLDGDGEYDPRDLPRVAAPVLAGAADYVLGARLPHAATTMRPDRHLGNRFATLVVSLLSGRLLQDGQTGYRAFSARALAQAEIVHDYNYAQVLTLDLLRKGFRLAQVPIRYRPRTSGRSFIRYPEYVQRVVPAMLREVLSA